MILFKPFLQSHSNIRGFLNFISVKALIDQEVKNGIPSHRIILGGFSQVIVGCAGMICYITLFFVCVIYRQCYDGALLPLKVKKKKHWVRAGNILRKIIFLLSLLTYEKIERKTGDFIGRKQQIYQRNGPN